MMKQLELGEWSASDRITHVAITPKPGHFPEFGTLEN